MLFILNREQEIIGTLTNNLPKALPYYNDVFKETLSNGYYSYQFETLGNHEDSVLLQTENMILRRKINSNEYYMLAIKEVNDSNVEGQVIRTVICESLAVTELIGAAVAPHEQVNQPAWTIIDFILRWTPSGMHWNFWQIGYVEDLEQRATFKWNRHSNKMEALQAAANALEMELEFLVTIEENIITSRIVNIYKARGNQVARPRFAYQENLLGASRQEDTRMNFTGVIPFGRDGLTLQNITNEEVEEITNQDEDVYLSGDRMTLNSRKAFERFSRGKVGTSFVINDTTSETTQELLKNAYRILQTVREPQNTYTVQTILLQQLEGYQHRTVQIGDLVTVIDKSYKPALVIAARIVELKLSETNPKSSEAVLGHHAILFSTDRNDIIRLQEAIREREIYWNNRVDHLEERVDEIDIGDFDFDNQTISERNLLHRSGSNWQSLSKWKWSEDAVRSGIVNEISEEDEEEIDDEIVIPMEQADYGLTNNGNIFFRNRGKSHFMRIPLTRTIFMNYYKNFILQMRARSNVSGQISFHFITDEGSQLGDSFIFNMDAGEVGEISDFNVVDATISGLREEEEAENENITGGEDIGGEEIETGGIVLDTNYLEIRTHNMPADSYIEFDWLQLVLGDQVPLNWSPAPEDLIVDIDDLELRLGNAELSLRPDRIITTVQESTELNSHFATNEGLVSTKEYMQNRFETEREITDQSVSTSLESANQFTNERISQVEQTAYMINNNFRLAGGVNLIRNSIGFSGFDFWETPHGRAPITISKFPESEAGQSNGFSFLSPSIDGRMVQVVNVNIGTPYTLSWRIRKFNTGNFTVSAKALLPDNEVAILGKYDDENRIEDIGGSTISEWTEESITFIATTNSIVIDIKSGCNALVDMTSLKLNIGTTSFTWTMHPQEIYSTDVRMDINGIRVQNNTENTYTIMTPREFAGYYTGGATPVRVFSMDRNEFQMNRSVVNDGIKMGNIEARQFNSATFNGWVFLPSI